MRPWPDFPISHKHLSQCPDRQNARPLGETIWDVGRPSIRRRCLPFRRCGHPVGDSFHISCRPENGQIEEPIAVVHRLDAAHRRPISLEEIGSLSEIADDVHHAYAASNQKGIERGLGRIPRYFPAHEVAVSNALFVRALSERDVDDVTSTRWDSSRTCDLKKVHPSHCSAAAWPVYHIK
jgi:hypothetical protein